MVRLKRDYLNGARGRIIEARQRLSRPSEPPIGWWSIIAPHDHDRGLPNDELIRWSLDAVGKAADRDLTEVAARCHGEVADWVTKWPGEHYRLLAALVAASDADLAVEVGTYLGPGALSMAAGSETVRVVTYDIVPWDEFDDTCLTTADFTDRFEQRIGDLGDDAYLATQIDTLRKADVLFFDAPKDGNWEKVLLPKLLKELSDRRRLVIFDDIRFVEMVDFWLELPYQKLDLTSFGHWSGTGVLWTA